MTAKKHCEPTSPPQGEAKATVYKQKGFKLGNRSIGARRPLPVKGNPTIDGHDAATTWLSTQEAATVGQIMAQYPRKLAGVGSVASALSRGPWESAESVTISGLGIKSNTESLRGTRRVAASVADAHCLTARVPVPARPPPRRGGLHRGTHGWLGVQGVVCS